MTIRIRFHGVAFFEIITDKGKSIFIDPCISLNHFSKINIDKILAPDILLITHGARDHIGDSVSLMQSKIGSTILCPRNVRTYLIKKNLNPDDIMFMLSGYEKNVEDVKVKAFETRHGSFLECDGQYLSDVSLAYLLTLRPNLKVLHMGDTDLHWDMKVIGEIYKPDIVLMPIGRFPGADTALNPFEAAIAASWMNAKKVIPMHYDPILQRDYPEELRVHLKKHAPDVELIILEPGETLEL